MVAPPPLVFGAQKMSLVGKVPSVSPTYPEGGIIEKERTPSHQKGQKRRSVARNQSAGRWTLEKAKKTSTDLKWEVRRKMNFTYVLEFVVLRDVVKVFPASSCSFARKTTGRNRARSHSGAWRGLKTKWDLKLSFPSLKYLIRYLFI